MLQEFGNLGTILLSLPLRPAAWPEKRSYRCLLFHQPRLQPRINH
ncbi:MAG: hypothetical protein ACLSHX_14705 [Suilimivivens sp.]